MHISIAFGFSLKITNTNKGGSSVSHAPMFSQMTDENPIVMKKVKKMIFSPKCVVLLGSTFVYEYSFSLSYKN